MTPQGTVSYTYDAAGRRTGMTVAGQTAVSYTYDNADRLTQITQGTQTVSFGYDAADRRTSLTLPNGVVVEYGYDAAGQLTRIDYKQGNTLIGDLTYQYDAAGNRVAAGGSFGRTGLPQPLASAVYDAANRLIQWGATALTYDDNGNLTGDGTSTYTWDARNRLASMTGASFQYDPFGRRTSKTIGGATTSYLYDGMNVVQETGAAAANLLTGLGIDEIFTRTDAGGTRHFLTDALGSTLALVDASGVAQTQYAYEPFGKVTVTGAPSSNPFQYTGRENDATGLYYHRARYYHPGSQRFTSEDPIRFGAGPNLYTYVADGPTVWTDPLGLQKVSGSWLDGFQVFLGILGQAPGWGEVADAGNAVVSGLRGDVSGAGLSLASMIPGLGNTPGAANIARIAKRFTPDQDALIQLAKECKRRGGVSRQQAETLLEWAREYGVRPARGPEIHPRRKFSIEHIIIGPVNHIPVK